MAAIHEKPFSCPSYDDGPSNFGQGADRCAREVMLQDKLADCLFRMELGNASYNILDTLLSQLDEVAPLPNDKSFDIENNLAKFYQKIHDIYAVSANQVSPIASRYCVHQRRLPSPLFFSCVYRRRRKGYIWTNYGAHAAIISIRWFRKKLF